MARSEDALLRKAESVLRLGRVTQRLPWLKGLGLVRSFYNVTLPFPDGYRFRVDDFDGDLRMEVDPRDIIGINVWHRPELFEKNERKLFCSAITPGSVVLDVGANVGIYTLLAAKRGARVFAIEADPNNVRLLRHHLDINGLTDRVTVFEMAAMDRQQTITLYRDPTNSGHSNVFSGVDATCVPGDTIDSLDLPAVDVCKMDIEGAEANALRGMLSTIQRSPKLRLLIEYSTQFGHTTELMGLLRLHFSRICIAGKGELSATCKAPNFCNLWASR